MIPLAVPVSSYDFTVSLNEHYFSLRQGHRGRATAAATNLPCSPSVQTPETWEGRPGPHPIPKDLETLGVGRTSALEPALMASVSGFKFENYYPGL